MNQNIKSDPPKKDEENPIAKLLSSSKNYQNIQIFKATKIVDQEIANSCSMKKEPSPNWDDLQKGRIQEDAAVIKVYKRRWLMLLIFIFYAIIGTFQWSMYAIIANIITKYYNVSNLSVDFTTLSYLITFLVAFLPAVWILNNLGLRWAMLISNFFNALGCFLRIFSVASDRFWLTMIGQWIVGFSQVFVLMIPSRLAAIWFPAHQVSFACAFAFKGILVGNAVGFLLPPIFVQNSDDLLDIAQDLDRLYLGLAALAFASFLLTAVFFQEKPSLPPSQAQRLQRSGATSTESLKEFLRSLKRLVTKRTYMTLLISFALSVGVFCALVTLLNQVLIPHFPGHEKEVGIVGLVLTVSGIVSAAICGYLLDRTHAFKLFYVAIDSEGHLSDGSLNLSWIPSHIRKTTSALYVLTLVGWIAFAVLLRFGNLYLIYVSAAILGFATTGIQPVGLEFGVEVTFPESEAMASGLMCAAVQAWGVLCTLLYGYLLESWGDDIANAVLAVPILIASVMSFFIRPRLKRQAAQRTKSPLEDIGC